MLYFHLRRAYLSSWLQAQFHDLEKNEKLVNKTFNRHFNNPN